MRPGVRLAARLVDQLRAGVVLHAATCPLGESCGWVKTSRALLAKIGGDR